MKRFTFDREHARDIVIFALCVLLVWVYLRPCINNEETSIESRNEYVVRIIVQESEPIKEPGEVLASDIYSYYTMDEIDLIAICTMAEAGEEPTLGQRLVIDTILNRLDSPYFNYDSIHDVIYAPNQFTSMTNGRVDQCYVKESIRKLVIEEMDRRTDSEVLYFRTGHYHEGMKDLYKIGNHYFSGQKT